MDYTQNKAGADVAHAGEEIRGKIKLLRARRNLLMLENPDPTHEVAIGLARMDVEEAELEIALREAQQASHATRNNQYPMLCNTWTSNSGLNAKTASFDLPTDNGALFEFSTWSLEQSQNIVDNAMDGGASAVCQDVDADAFNDLVDWDGSPYPSDSQQTQFNDSGNLNSTMVHALNTSLSMHRDLPTIQGICDSHLDETLLDNALQPTRVGSLSALHFREALTNELEHDSRRMIEDSTQQLVPNFEASYALGTENPAGSFSKNAQILDADFLSPGLIQSSHALDNLGKQSGLGGEERVFDRNRQASAPGFIIDALTIEPSHPSRDPAKRKRMDGGNPRPSPKSQQVAASIVTEALIQCFPLPMKVAKRKRQGGEDYTHGTFCFYSRPPVKRSRRRVTELEQQSTNKVRRKGACLRCRMNNLKCSEEDPCKACDDALRSGRPTFGGRILSLCIRALSEADPFEFLRDSSLSYLARGRPRWSSFATGRPNELSTTVAVECLSVINLIRTPDAPPTLANPSLEPWTKVASNILQVMDETMRKKHFWQSKEFVLVLLAAADLWMSIALDLLQYVRYIKDSLLAFNSALDVNNLVDRARFCIQRILVFRRCVLPRMGMSHCGYLEESAAKFLDQSFHTYPQSHRYMAQLLSSADTSYLSGSSKQLLLLQSTQLGLADVVAEAIDAGALPDMGFGLQNNRTALDLAVKARDTTIAGLLLQTHPSMRISREVQLSAFVTAIRNSDEAMTLMLAESIRKLVLDKASPCIESQIGMVVEMSISVPHKEGSIRLEHPFLKVLLIVHLLAVEQHIDIEKAAFLGHEILTNIDMKLALDALQQPHALRYLLDIRDHRGRTALHVACESATSNLGVVPWLISAGPDPNSADFSGRTPLHLACRIGAFEAIKSLAEAGACINVKDNGGITPLYCACYGGVVKIIRYLVGVGADVNATDRSGDTPLHRACASGLIESVQYLVEAGAGIHTRNIAGVTPLRQACTRGTIEIVRCLTEAGADVNVPDNNGISPLHLMCSERETELVRYLIASGASLNAANHTGATPLHCACMNVHSDEVAALLIHTPGVELSCVDNLGRTALHLACALGWHRIATALIDHGTDVNVRTCSGLTPLHYIFALAVSHVPSWNHQTTTLNGKIEELQELTERSYQAFTSRPLFTAPTMTRKLIEKGANAFLSDEYGRTPLHQIWMAFHRDNADLVVLPSESEDFQQLTFHDEYVQVPRSLWFSVFIGKGKFVCDAEYLSALRSWGEELFAAANSRVFCRRANQAWLDYGSDVWE